ncbi:hypothetical protein [Streptomyces albicerus]|uniref:hypothetical protein n=1 Tax=Streptomyces albicerus TaxID=2569859 RepID=UPI00124B246E|nr:hypothetical protein [Streptomyces albicerus]
MSENRHRPDDHRPLDDRRWLDEPRNVTRIVYGLAVLCALALLADLFYTKHPYFSVERWSAFYAVYGFVGSVTLVLTAKGLRRLLRRDEDYYEPPEHDRYESAERDRDDD